MNRFHALIAAASLMALSLAWADAPLQFEDPWSPLAPPGRTMAGFVVIDNPGPDDIVLVDASSTQFGRVEIHTMAMDDGVMRMRRLDELEVPAGESVTLEPGGRHFMLYEPTATFEDGDHIEIELVDSDEQRHELVLRVRPRD